MLTSPKMTVRQFHRLTLLVAFIIYLVTAIKSEGYYHPDEHYQLIEFAGLKLGTNQPSDLAWEYNARVRSAFQPAVCFVVFKTLNAIGIHNPYHLALSLRLLTLFFALAVITLFTRSSLPFISEKLKKPYILLSYLLWFLPFINIRFTSESWSGLFCLLALALIQLSERNYALAGAALGFSFLCRFQIAFPVIGLIAWLIFIKKAPFKRILTMITSGLIIWQLGILIDWWFYGEYVYTCWYYFKVNIILDVASKFGRAPWYTIIWYIIKFGIYPIGICLFASIILLTWRKWKNMFIWIILPFLIMHSAIAHKELRFLFPIANLIPLIIILSIQGLPPINKWLMYPALTILALFNITGIAALASKAAGAGRATITHYIHDHYKCIPKHLAISGGNNPYDPWSLKENFYKENDITIAEIDHGFQPGKGVNLVLVPLSYTHLPQFQNRIKISGLQERIQSVPDWIIKLNRWYNGFYEDDVLVLYEFPKM